MAQYDFGTIDPAVMSGAGLAAALTSWRTALNSCHKGPSQPSYRIAGISWMDDTTTPWVLKTYDGADWLVVGYYNATTNVFSPVGGSGAKWTTGGRLTLASLNPVPTTDVAAAATLYYTPYKSDTIGIYTGSPYSDFIEMEFAQASITLAGLTAGLPYDAYLYNSAGTLTIELLAWTNATTRASAITEFEGVKIKLSDATRRYAGTLCIKATGQCEDSLTDRLLWNMYNRVKRPMLLKEPTDSWAYTTATIRQARATATNRLAFVNGLDEEEVRATLQTHFSNTSGGVAVSNGIGLDSSTTPATTSTVGQAYSVAAQVVANSAEFAGLAGVGYHELRWLEMSAATGATTWYGDAGVPTQLQSGMAGEVFA